MDFITEKCNNWKKTHQMSSTRVWTGQRKESVSFKYDNKNYSMWEEIQRAEQKQMQLLAPNNHIKNTSACGVLLTESKLKLAEKLLYSQGYRKNHTKSGLKGEEVRSGSMSLGGRHRDRITQSQRPSLGNERLKPHTGHSTPGVQHREGTLP